MAVSDAGGAIHSPPLGNSELGDVRGPADALVVVVWGSAAISPMISANTPSRSAVGLGTIPAIPVQKVIVFGRLLLVARGVHPWKFCVQRLQPSPLFASTGPAAEGR
jgi:hypothetical protein